MIVAYSIADGIMMVILSFVLIKLISGRQKEITAMTWVLFGLFIFKIVMKACV
jgi:AGZA family xanthine/uracil permease-like MFS transporter